MREVDTKQPQRCMECNVEQETVNIGILAAKSNRKLKKSLYQLKDIGELYKNGHFIAFSLKGINQDKHRVKGYIYESSKRIWKAATFRFPNAIINQITLSNNWESYFRHKTGCRVINNFTFNKFEMYKWLSFQSKLSNHLPITRLITCPQDIIDFIGQYNEGFIKPISGSYGKGVIKITQHEESFKVDTARHQKQNNSLYLNHGEVMNFFKTRCKKRQYIIQQVIDLYVGKHPIDFRLIMVKDSSGAWNDLGLIARKGSKNGIVSNTGLVKSGNAALQNLLSIPRFEAIQIRQKITDLCFEVAKEIGKYRGNDGNLGNLGIDLAIDKNRQLWIIEINHRNPQHRMAVDAGESRFYNNANKLMIDYAFTLGKLAKGDFH